MKWSDKDKRGKEWKNTYGPGSCLVGWEAEMKKIDEKYATMGLLGTTNPAAEAQRKCEAAAKQKAEALAEEKERLVFPAGAPCHAS